MFKRRLGPDPHLGTRSPRTPAVAGCPDIWELESGDYAVIGIDKTDILSPHLPPSASCGPDERIVVVPRRILVDAKSDIPTSV